MKFNSDCNNSFRSWHVLALSLKFSIMNGINVINFRLSHQQLFKMVGAPGYGK